MRLHHGVAQEGVGLVRHLIEQAAGVAGAAVRVGGGEGGYELRNKVDVAVEGAHEHEGVDLEEGGGAVTSQLEETEALSLSRAPYPRRTRS